MSTSLRIPNFTYKNIKQETSLSDKVDEGTQSIAVVSSADIVPGDIAIIGTRGTDTSEMHIVQSVPDSNTLVLSSVVQIDHTFGEHVIIVVADKFQVYRAPVSNGALPPDDSTFVAAGDPFPMQSDRMMTTYTDAADTDCWYKYIYVNSITGAISRLSDSTANRSTLGLYESIDVIRRESGFENNDSITDEMINIALQEAQVMIDSSLAGKYTVPFAAPINRYIQSITKMVAVAKLLMDQYRGRSTGLYQQGKDMMADAEATLAKIRGGQLVLLDPTGGNIPTSQASVGVGGYINPDGNIFSMSDRY